MFDLPMLTGPAGEIVGQLLNNGILVAVMVLVVALLSRLLRRPELAHVLWSATLVKLFTPALFVVALPVAIQTTSGPGEGLSASDLSALAALQGSGSQSWWTGRESELLFGFWLAGALVAGLLIWTRQRRWNRMVAHGKDASPELQARIAGLSKQLELSHAPTVRVVDAVTSPAVIGPLFSSALLVMPKDLIENLKKQELDAVVVHELAHLKRRDPWIRRLEIAAVVAYWWNPVVHWARRHLHQWEEMSCDLAVLRALPEHRKAYAHALIATLEHIKNGARPVPMTAHGLGSPHTWKERLHMIMLQDTASPSKFSRRLVQIFAVGLVAFSPLLVNADLPDEKGAQATTVEVSASDEKQYTGEPIDMDLKDAPLKDVLRSFASIADINMVIPPEVTGTVTVQLDSVPWDQALDQILKINGLAMSVDGGIVRIGRADELSTGKAGKVYVGDPISLSLKNADLQETLGSLAKIGALEMYVSPEVDGKVTVELKAVPWDQALDQIVSQHNLDMRIEGKLVHIATRAE